MGKKSRKKSDVKKSNFLFTITVTKKGFLCNPTYRSNSVQIQKKIAKTKTAGRFGFSVPRVRGTKAKAALFEK
jgi:hypothetical protein